MPYYMNWGNTTPPKITGDATDKDHVNWIELDSFSFGTTRGPSAGGWVRKDGSKDKQPTITDITVTKTQDSASSPLFREATAGNPQTVVIHAISSANFLSLRLTETVISTFSVSSKSGVETIGLNFTKMEWGTGANQTPHSTLPPFDPSDYPWAPKP